MPSIDLSQNLNPKKVISLVIHMDLDLEAQVRLLLKWLRFPILSTWI